MSQLDLICEMGAEFAHLPDGPPDEGTMRLRLPFEQMETLKGYVDDLRLKGESRSQAIARIVRYVAKKTPTDTPDKPKSSGRSVSQIPL